MRTVTFNPPHKEALAIMGQVNQLSLELKRQQDHNYRLVKAVTILLNDPKAGQLAFSSCQEARNALGAWYVNRSTCPMDCNGLTEFCACAESMHDEDLRNQCPGDVNKLDFPE